MLNGSLMLQGQVYAVMSHRISDKEVRTIKAADIPIMVIHGRHDIMALPKYGERLAQRCKLVPNPLLLTLSRDVLSCKSLVSSHWPNTRSGKGAESSPCWQRCKVTCN